LAWIRTPVQVVFFVAFFAAVLAPVIKDVLDSSCIFLCGTDTDCLFGEPELILLWAVRDDLGQRLPVYRLKCFRKPSQASFIAAFTAVDG
jgi:hypothetical protein